MGFYGTLKMIFYKVSRKGGGFFFALCVVAKRRCHLHRARLPQSLRRASRTADCAATAEDARRFKETSGERRFQSYRLLRCYIDATLQVFLFSLLSMVT